MRKSDEHSAQKSEDISLNESHQHLKTVHEEHHYDADEVKTKTIAHSHRPTEEYHTSETQDDCVACHHVGKETDHKSKRLGEHSKELYHWHERHRIGLEEERHFRPEDVLPILFIAEEVDGNHRTEGKEERDVDVSCHIRATRKDRQKT